MKNLLKILSLLFIHILLLFFFSCSPDEETPAPTNTVQYTLTVTADNGGSVTGGGTYDEGTQVTITASVYRQQKVN